MKNIIIDNCIIEINSGFAEFKINYEDKPNSFIKCTFGTLDNNIQED